MKRFLILLCCAPFGVSAHAEDVSQRLFRKLIDPRGVAALGAAEPDRGPLVAVYRARGFDPLWVDQEGPTQRAFVILDRLKRAGRARRGPPASDPERIETLLRQGSPAALADAELMLTSGVARHVRGLQRSSVAEERVPGTAAETERFDLRDIIARLTAAPDLDAYLTGLEASSARSLRLSAALRDYRALARSGGWPTIPAGRAIAPGDTDPRVPVLRRRLALTGDYTGPDERAIALDAQLVRAIERFQRRHGLGVDGVVGRRTRAALNLPARGRVDQLALNLERRHWLPPHLGKRYVFVNIADASVKYVEDERTLLDMRAVVGRPYRKTPVFKADITGIRFNPSWYVPASIARADLLPKIARDTGLLARDGYDVLSGGGPAARVVDSATVDWSAYPKAPFPFLLRQRPGPGNALGRIKFLMPNRHDVYLHDTPARDLLKQSGRAFSSGCIRLEKPLALSALLLRDQPAWSRQAIREVIDSAKTVSVPLSEPVPVYVTYLTAWVNKDGIVHFRDDLYGRDRRLAAKLSLRSR